VVIDRTTESQRSHFLLERDTHSREMEMEIATVVAIRIRKLARRITVPRKAIR
jgi:hypothetical protein